jgi:hypothetical protein
MLCTRTLSNYEITKIPLIIIDHSFSVDFNWWGFYCVVL